ncbi:vWA domain-containing protein [Aquibacillus albus]|uniref:Ca-activated chloride channel family protein n=1 Tax=Aquibacillus albus TaxID=1168171 RepID=A0ABS2MVQ3_9BACI|nr:VWA domain-containing protein [Aquibacillus albus]MBM7569954.1 Ca-activated chloride channel family protein [Aquibacillus albus]
MRNFLVVFLGLLLLFFAACKSGNEDSASEDQANDSAASTDQSSMEMETVDRAIQPAPPNGADYDTMFFEEYGTNPFVSTDDDTLSTFAMDVDTGSYSVMRNYIKRGTLPPDEAIRVEEFVNYFKTNLQAPTTDTFAIHVDGGKSSFGEGYHLLRVGIKGKEIEVEDRKNANLTFVIDVSGSMNRENRLGLVKKSLKVLVDELQPADQVGIVVYGSRGRVVLNPTSIDEKDRIMDAIEELQPEGSTNAEEGLTLGYELAREYFTEDAINRVVLVSDGVANVGETGHEQILNNIKDYAKKDITLSTFGFGMGNYNDVLMEQLANNGDGNYAYIDSFSEARRIFMEELTGTLQTIAKDAKIQVEFDPEKVDRYRLLGYENRDVRDEDFRNDSVDGGEVGAGHTVTALYEVKVKEDTDALGEVRLRYLNEETQEVEEVQSALSFEGDSLPEDLLFLSAVAEFAEILGGSYWAKESSLESVLELAESSAQREEHYAFVELVKDTIALRR